MWGWVEVWAEGPTHALVAILGLLGSAGVPKILISVSHICCCQPSNGVFMIYYTITPPQQRHYTFTRAVKSLNVGYGRRWPDRAERCRPLVHFC